MYIICLRAEILLHQIVHHYIKPERILDHDIITSIPALLATALVWLVNRVDI